jgi:hypothetical protein
VCHDYHGSALAGALKRSLYKLLALRVKRAGGLVQEENVRVADQGASNGYTLFLPARERDAARANVGVVSLGQGDDEVVDGGIATGLVQLIFGGGLVVYPEQNVFSKRAWTRVSYKMQAGITKCLLLPWNNVASWATRERWRLYAYTLTSLMSLPLHRIRPFSRS